VAAAGSATGMETFIGCHPERASFNVLELRSDRSVWIKEICGPGGGHTDWHEGPEIELLDSTTLRRNRFLRSLHLWRKGRADLGEAEAIVLASRQSEWRKHITLTARRDAIVRERRTHWLISGGEFSFRIQNDTGQPARPQATLDLVEPASVPRLLGFSRLAGEPGAYSFRVSTGTTETVAAKLIETSYQWLDAVLLTQGDLELIDMNTAGPFRGSGQEFVAASVITPLRELSLSVTFPVGYYPGENSAKVYHQRISGSEPPIEDAALHARLQFTGQTLLLTVPYPLLDYRYIIAWTPVPARSRSTQAKAFHDRCGMPRIGDELAASFLRGVETAGWGKHCSVALYVPEREDVAEHEGRGRGRSLRRVGFAKSEADIPEAPPTFIDLRERVGLYLHAWFDETGIFVCDPAEFDARARREGVLLGEFVTAVVPFRGIGDAVEPPWGFVRVGVLVPVPELAHADEIDGFRGTLARGYVKMLDSLPALS
jgi:hypothetical protein